MPDPWKMTPLDQAISRMVEHEPSGYCEIACEDGGVQVAAEHFEKLAKCARKDMVLTLTSRLGTPLVLWCGNITAVSLVTPESLERQKLVYGDEANDSE